MVTCEIEHEINAVSQGFVFQFRDSVNRINTYPQQVIISKPKKTTNMSLHERIHSEITQIGDTHMQRALLVVIKLIYVKRHGASCQL